MQIFDGFIAAVADELKLKFVKTHSGVYTTKIEFENDRSHEVMVSLAIAENGDRMIHYNSIVAKLKSDSAEIYKYALQTNNTLDYGALTLIDTTLILRNSIPLEGCEPMEFMKTLTYVAAKADELEELLTSENKY